MEECAITKILGVETAILSGCGEAEDGVLCILNLIIDIMTAGIAILGVIGIAVVGIQYLTSSGDEAKARKARTRMSEIIIGLAVYAVMYIALKFLFPGFN